MAKSPAQVRAILDLDFPQKPDKTKLIAIEIKVHDLFLLLCDKRDWKISAELYPALFEETPDTPRMIENRMKAQRILKKYYRSMTPDQYHGVPEFSDALKIWSKNSSKYVPGTLLSVLGFSSAFAYNTIHGQNRSGEIYFYTNKYQMLKELKKLKQLLRLYFSE